MRFLKLKLHFRRTKYVFSELNESSVCLAEDIMRDDNYTLLGEEKIPPIIIFCNVGQNDDENSAALAEKARKLGAFCITRDITSLKLEKTVSVNYFLISERPAVMNLIYEVPLYTPIVGTDRKEINVAAIGSGKIAEESLETAFSYSQMIGYRCNIHVIVERGTDFEKRFNEQYPFLMASCQENAEQLRV